MSAHTKVPLGMTLIPVATLGKMHDRIAQLHGLKGELVDALRPFVDCDFTYFSGKVLGSDARLTREQVECARAVIAKAESERVTPRVEAVK